MYHTRGRLGNRYASYVQLSEKEGLLSTLTQAKERLYQGSPEIRLSLSSGHAQKSTRQPYHVHFCLQSLLSTQHGYLSRPLATSAQWWMTGGRRAQARPGSLMADAQRHTATAANPDVNRERSHMESPGLRKRDPVCQ